MTPQNRASSKIALWRADPVQFVRDEFLTEPDEWQKDFLVAFNNNPRTAAKACKGPGKTAVLAWCAWLFLATRPHPKVIATSITGRNLRDGLWSEMAKWQKKSKFLTAAFTWQSERIILNDHPETWFMSARSWSPSADPQQQADTLAGLHADYILFIIDEAGGIPDAVMAAAEAALASGIECKLLICGNPTHLSGPLYRACTSSASLWHVIEITGDPDDPKRSPRINLEWAREMIRTYGRDHPWVMVNVLGKFPPSSFNALLSPDEIQASMKRVLPLDAYNTHTRILGVDVALQGDDRTVIMPRQGPVMFRPKVLRIADSKEIASVLVQAINRFKPDAVFIDDTGGWATGVKTWMQEWNYSITPVNFSSKADDPQFLNKRSEMAWTLADWVKGGGCMPEMPELKEEATAITYTHKKHQLMITEKAQIKVDLGRSPDLWDAAALTFAYPVRKKTVVEEMFGVKPTQWDYNPLASPVNHKDRVDDYNPLM